MPLLWLMHRLIYEYIQMHLLMRNKTHHYYQIAVCIGGKIFIILFGIISSGFISVGMYWLPPEYMFTRNTLSEANALLIC